MSTPVKVFIALTCVAFAFLLIPAFMIANPNLVGPLMGDPSESLASVRNDCGATLLFSGGNRTESTVTSAAGYKVEAGETYSDALGARYSARVYGGLWTPGVMPNGETETPLGADCPLAATPTELAVLRAPMLADAEVLSVDVTPQVQLAEAPEGSEVTTIVATVTPEQANEWQARFAMVPLGGADDNPGALLEGAVPGADWYHSDAFDSAIPAELLVGYAYLDPETGTVVARVRDKQENS